MENWEARALPHVYDAYLTPPGPTSARPAPAGGPQGELFHLALLQFSEQRHAAQTAAQAAPVRGARRPRLVAAESGSLLSILYRFLRNGSPSA